MFKNRIGGVLKKIHDLTVLCGLQATLVITDVEANIHTFTNSNQMHLLLKETFNKGIDEF